MAAGIDIHNHIRTGSLGIEDVWHTRKYIHRQFGGIIGFAFTNAYLAVKHFSGKSVESEKNVCGEHTAFKMKLCNQMINYNNQVRPLRNLQLQAAPGSTTSQYTS